MVAVVGGAELGLGTTSGQVLGGAGLLGRPDHGRGGEGVYVNAATGNLILQRRDELLIGQGEDIDVLRTYNSLGLANDDNGDNWRLNFSRRVTGLTGTLNTVGSTVTRIGEDGAAVAYTYDAARGLYVSFKGAGAVDTLSLDGATQRWVWTDGDSGSRERYDNAQGGRLVEVIDADGNALTLGYNAGGLVNLITNANGERTAIDYDTAAGRTANITQIRTLDASNNTVLTRVSYGYDSNNRLQTVTVDLSPEDNSTADGRVYVTTYTYDGASNRIASLQQTDGSRLEFTYVQVGGDYRVSTISDVRGTDIRTTTYAYDTATRTTLITDPLGQLTTLTYDTSGQLLSVVAPAVNGEHPESHFTYDANGNVTTITDARGNTVIYQYDANGNRVLERDAAGNTITRVYDAQNLLLSETSYRDIDPDGSGAGQPDGAQVTRYVYDGERHLRFVISAEGRVTEYRYNAVGQQISRIRYASEVATDLPPSPSEAQLGGWAAAQDPMTTQQEDRTYDVRGLLSGVTNYFDQGPATTHYIYDQAGQLLLRVDPRGQWQSGMDGDYATSFTYDGLGRVLSMREPTDNLYVPGALTLTTYDDVNRRTTVTQANGLTTITTYDQAGVAVAISQADATGQLGSSYNVYDDLGRLRMSVDAAGAKQFFAYDEAGRLSTQIDATGALSRFLYNGNGQVIQAHHYANRISAAHLAALAADPILALPGSAIPAVSDDDRFTQWAYDAAGRMAKRVDAVDGTGALTEYRYDGSGQLVETIAYATLLVPGQMSALRNTLLEVLVDDAALSPVADAANDRHIRQFYSDDGLLLGTLDAEGYLTENRYDAVGQRIEVVRYATASPAVYRAAGSLEQLRPAAGQADQHEYYLYDSRGQLLMEFDAEGYPTYYEYDRAGNRATSVRFGIPFAYAGESADVVFGQLMMLMGPETPLLYQTFGYDASHRLVGEMILRDLSGPPLIQTLHQYDAMGNLVRTTRATSSGQRGQEFIYDSQGRLTGELTPAGSAALRALGLTPAEAAALAQQYGVSIEDLQAGGMVVATQAQVDAVWAEYGISHAYDAVGNRIHTSDANGDSTRYYYDAEGRLTHTLNALGEIHETFYNAFGQVESTRAYADRLSSAVLATLDGGIADATFIAALATIASASLDSIERFGYNQRGDATDFRDALNNRTEREYNAFGELSKVITPVSATGQRTDTITYDRRGLQVNALADAMGAAVQTSVVYDAFGRVIEKIDGRGTTWRMDYDRLGRVVSTTDPGNPARITTYDAMGRALTQSDALGNITTYAYDDVANTVTITSPENISVTTAYNGYGEVVSVTDGRGNTTTYTYDTNGQLTSVADAAGTRTSVYDNAGQKIESIDANGVRTEYTYDAAGRELSRTLDPSGLNLTSSTRYDAKGRVAWQRDANGVWTQTQYNLNGEVTAVVIDPKRGPDWAGGADDNPNGLQLTTGYTYDARGRVLTVVEGEGSSQPKTTRYVYDALGRRVGQHVDPDGLNLTTLYRYDANDNLIARTDGAGPLNLVTRYVYDERNQKIFEVDATGAVRRLSYDNEGRVIQTTAYADRISFTSPTVLSNAVTMQDVLDRLAQARATYAANPANQIDHRVYDQDGRLRFSIDAGGYVTARDYDATGNVNRITRYSNALSGVLVAGTPPVIVPESGTAPASGSYIQAAASDRTERYVYDAANRLIFQVDAGGYLTQYSYDANGNMVREVAYANALIGSVDSGVPQVIATGTASGPYVVASAAHDRVTRHVFDAAGRERYTIDAQGYVVARNYNGRGEEEQRVRYAEVYTVADGSTTASLVALLPATPPATAAVEHTRYDAAGRVWETQDAEGGIIRHVYDAAGREIDTIYAYGTPAASTTHRLYDDAGRLTDVIQAYGTSYASTTRYQLDAAGHRRFIINPRGIELAESDSAWAVAMRKVLGFTLNGEGKPAGELSTIERQVLMARYTLEQEFDALGRVTASIDPSESNPAGLKTLTQYDAFGNVIKVTDTRGYSAHYYYNTRNLAEVQIDPAGYATRSEFNAFGELFRHTVFVTKALSGHSTDTPLSLILNAHLTANASKDTVTRTVYNARGQVVEVHDAHGFVEYFGYDGLGNKISYTDRRGSTYSYQYDRNGRMTRESSPPVSVISLDANGIPSTSTQGLVNEYSYDARGNRTHIREAVGLPQARTTVVHYDLLNREWQRDLPAVTVFNPITKTSNVVTPSITTRYDQRGNVVETIDVRGQRSLAYFDALDRQIATVDVGGTLRVFGYDTEGNLVAERAYDTRLDIGALSWTTQPAPVAGDTYRELYHSYDANNRRISTRTGETTLFDSRLVLDPKDPYAESSPYVHTAITTYNEYDANGNLVRSIDGRGYFTLYFYDALGQEILRVDPLGYVTGTAYDEAGRVTRVARYEQKLEASTIAALSVNSIPEDLRLEVEGAGEDRIVEYDYDRLGRKVAERLLDVRHTVVAVDGTLTALESDIATSYEYDRNGNLTGVIKPDGAQIDYVYDALNRLTDQYDIGVTVATGHAGNTVQTTVADIRTSWGYDALGNETVETRYGLAGADNRVTTYRHDAQGNVVAAWDAMGQRSDYALDAAGNVLRQTRYTLDIDDVPHTHSTYYSYDAAGRETQRQVITDEGATNQVTGERVWSSYNAHGDIVARGINDNVQHEYRYDAIGKLFWTNNDTGTPRIYLYDASGNAVLEMLSGNTDLSQIQSPAEVEDLPLTTVQIKYSVFDGRNQITDVFDTPASFASLTGKLDAPDLVNIENSAITTPGNVTGTGSSSQPLSGQERTTIPGNPPPPVYNFVWGNASYNPSSTVRTELNPTQVNQAAHGQSPVSLAPSTTTQTFHDAPNITRVVTTVRTAQQSGNTVTVTRKVTTVTTKVLTAPPTVVTSPDVIDYVEGTAEGQQETTTVTQTITDQKEEIFTDTIRSYQTVATSGDVIGGAATRGAVLNYWQGTVGIGWNNFNVPGVTSGAGWTVFPPQIPEYGDGPGHILIEENRGAGYFTVHNTDITSIFYRGPIPNGLSAIPTLRITITKNGFTVFFWEGQPQQHGLLGTSPYPTIPLLTLKNIGLYPDGLIKSATANIGGGPVQLTRYDVGGTVQWMAQGVGVSDPNNVSWKFTLYNSTIQDFGTLAGAVTGSNLANTADQATRQYLYVTGATTSFSRYEGTSSTSTGTTKTDTVNAREQRNYFRQLAYSVVTGVTKKDQIRRQQTYNAFGEVDSETDGRDNKIRFEYNELGRLILKKDPLVSYTEENGTVHDKNFSPETHYQYDAAGQLVAETNARGITTIKQRFSHGRLVESYDALGYSIRNFYNTFGNLVASNDELGRLTRYEYDKNNRLIRTDFAGGNYDRYEYDTLGNRIAHINGLGHRETYLFDGEGRITRYRSFEGRQTSYSYEYHTGIGERGGYRTVTTDAMGTTLVEDTDIYGKLRFRQDLGGRIYNYQYSNAGWLIHQESTAGQNIDYEYYANGYLKRVNDHGVKSYALFEYDEDGNRTLEMYSQSVVAWGGPGTTHTTTTVSEQPYQMARAEYDALNRLVSVKEEGKFKVSYEYDEVGNRRRVLSEYRDVLAYATQPPQDFWYKYDELNRFTTTMGAFDQASGQIVRGSGYEITYVGNERRTQTTTDENGKWIKERYVYDDNGFLTETWINPDAAQGGSGVERRRAERVNNQVGQRLSYNEYDDTGIATSRHQYTYDKDHNLLTDHDVDNNKGVTYLHFADGRVYQANSYNNEGAANTSTTYEYEAWDSYQQKEITIAGIAVQAPDWKNGTSMFTYDVNGHVKQVFDHHIMRFINYISNHHGQTLRRYDSDQDQSTNPVIRYFYYFNGKPIGDQGTDHVESRVDYAQSLRASELEGPGNKRYIEEQRRAMLPDAWRQFISGEISGDAFSSLYGKVGDKPHEDIGRRVIPVTSADFDQNFQPINEGYPGQAPTSYVVQQGDTLQGIAAKVWGDSSLWYMLADANGLFGSESLVTNQRLTIPNVVTNFHNNSETYRAFEAGLTLGDTAPTLPEPPPPPAPRKKGKKCGGIGQILVAIVAVVVTVYTAGLATSAFASAGVSAGSVGAATAAGSTIAATAGGTAALGGAALAGSAGLAGFAGAVVGGAVGSIVSQGVAIATGLQDGFSWSGVALSAIGAGAMAGVGTYAQGLTGAGSLTRAFANPTSWTGAAMRASVANVATQGVAVATGMQKRFDWRGVAASAVGTAIGHGVGEALGHGIAPIVSRTLRGLVSGGAQAAIQGHSPNWGAIAASSFGNAAGSGLVDGFRKPASGLVEEQEQRQAEKREQQLNAESAALAGEPVDQSAVVTGLRSAGVASGGTLPEMVVIANKNTALEEDAMRRLIAMGLSADEAARRVDTDVTSLHDLSRDEAMMINTFTPVGWLPGMVNSGVMVGGGLAGGVAAIAAWDVDAGIAAQDRLNGFMLDEGPTVGGLLAADFQPDVDRLRNWSENTFGPGTSSVIESGIKFGMAAAGIFGVAKAGWLRGAGDVPNNNVRFSGGANRNTAPLTSVQQQDVLDYAKVLGTDADNIRFYSYDAPSNYSDLLDTVFVGPDIYPGAGMTTSVVDRLSMRATLAHEVVGHRYSTLAGRDFSPGSYLDEFQASYRAAKLAPDLTSTERYQLLKDSVRRLHSENITVKQFKASDDFTKLYLD